MSGILGAFGVGAVVELAPATVVAGPAQWESPDRRRVPWSTAVPVLVAAATLAAVVTVSAVRPLPAAPTRIDAPAAPGSLPAGLAPVAAAAMAPLAYHLAPTVDGWQATNPAQGLQVDFSAEGLQIATSAGGAELGLELARVGRSGDLHAPAAAELEADGARIAYDRGSLTEWYVNDTRGVEQGFTLDRPPVGSTHQPVVVELAPTGGFTPVLDAAAESVRFVGDGATFTYSGLHAYDADARPLSSELGVADGKVTLTVDDRGAAYPVTIDPFITTEQAHLHAPDATPQDVFGSSVAVWGDTAVIGAPNTDAGGVAYVFVRTGTAWAWQATLTGSTTGSGDEFGSAVAISGPSPSVADTIVVGAPGDTENAGAGLAYAFVRTGGTWAEQSVLLDPAGSPLDRFGASVGVSEDSAVVGAPNDRTTTGGIDAGSASTFRRSGTTWSFEANLQASDADPGDHFGRAVAISGDTVVVGVPDDRVPGFEPTGSIYVFVRGGGGTWSIQADALKASNIEPRDHSGTSVAIHGDVLAIGAPSDLVVDSGSVSVWTRSGTTWTEDDVIEPDGVRSFGAAVAISEDILVVGDPDANSGVDSPDEGTAWIYTRQADGWFEREELHQTEGDSPTGDDYGAAVALAGEYAVVGTPFDTTPAGHDAGSAYVYRVDREVAVPTIDLAAGQNDPTRQDTIDFEVTFSHDVPSFTPDDVVISGTAPGALDVVVQTVDAAHHTVSVSGMTGGGTVVLEVPAGTVTDEHGLPSGDPIYVDNEVMYDLTAPTVTVHQPLTQADPTSVSPIHFTVTFSEDVVGFGPQHVTLSQDTGPLTATVQPITGRRVFDVSVSGMDVDGDVVATIGPGRVADDAGNLNAASATGTDNLVQWVDTASPPTVNAGPSRTGFEGSPIALDGTVVDADGGVTTTWTVIGPSFFPLDPGTTCTFADPHAVDTTLTCDDDATQLELRLTADDGLHAPVSDNVFVDVANLSPEMGTATAPIGPQPITSTIEVSVPFTDAGANDTHTCTANWNDGTPVAAGTLSGGTCTASHVYTTRDHYVAALVVQDDDGSIDQTNLVVDVGNAVQQIVFSTPGAKHYGDAPFTMPVEATSGLPVSLSVPAGGPCTISGTTVTILDVGTCTITGTQAGDATYLPAQPQTFDVEIRKITQSIDELNTPTTRITTDPPFPVSGTASSGLPLSFSVEGPCTIVGATVTVTGAGTCAITASQPGDDHYEAAQPITQNVTITKASQTVDFQDPGPRAIGEVFTVSAAASSGLPVTFSVPSGGPCTVSGSTVTVTASGTCTITASQAGDDTYLPAEAERDVFIAEQSVQTITLIVPPNRTYGDAPFTVGATATSGLPVTISVPAGAPCTVSGLTVTITAGGGLCTITASQPGNAAYLPAPDETESVAIHKAPLTISGSDVTRSYGSPGTLITPTYDGFVNGEDESVLTTLPTCGGGGSATTPAGTHPTSCSGAAAANYTITYSEGTLTIAPAALVITASSATMTYGGVAPATTPSYGGFVNGQGPSVLTTAPTCGSGVTSTTPAGEHATSCSGAVAPNYELAYVDGTLTVDPAPLVITASDATTTYGGAAVVTAAYDGFVNGEDDSVLTTDPICGGGAPTTPVGAHLGATSCSGAVAANYAITYVPGDLTVTRAGLVVTASGATMTYGGTPPTVTASYVGFVNGEGPSVLTTAPTCGGGSAITPAGSHPGATTCSGAAAANYDISYEDGTLTVERAPLTVTASAGSMTYGGTPPTVTASYAGFVNGEGPSVLTTAPTCVGGSPTTPAGTHAGGTSCSGAAAANYDIGYVDGTLTVGKAPLTVTASDATMTYGGAAPTVTPSYAGLVNGEGPSVLATAPICIPGPSTNPAGTYPGATSCSGAAAANYDIGYVSGALTVLPAPLVITASDASMTYGGAVPTVTPSYSGYVNGESSSVLTTSATCAGGSPTTPAGVHPGGTSCSGAAAANYDISYVNGTLTVERAVLVVTADHKSKEYGQAVPPLTYTTTGFVNGETASVLSGSPALSTPATPTSNVGTYPILITTGTLTAANYRFVFTHGLLTVTRASTTLTAAPVLIKLTPTKVNLGTVSARLTSSTPARPVAGQTIVFTAGGTALCTATTSANGSASCKLDLGGALATILNLGYTATYAGNPNLLPSTGDGPLIS